MEANVSISNFPLEIDSVKPDSRNIDVSDSFFNSLPPNLPKAPPSRTALSLLEEELTRASVLSLNTELDKVLKDEIAPKRITELVGFPGSGRTQVCFQLCITTQLPKSLGGLEGQVIYISTNKNFSSRRLRELCEKLIKQVAKTGIGGFDQFNVEYILKNIYVFKNESIGELFATVTYLDEFLKGKSVRLVLIDSISRPFKDVESKERSTLLYRFLENLQNLAVMFNFALVLTNDFTTRVKDNEAYYTPSFGDSFLDRVNTRICFSRSSVNNIHEAELVKSVLKAPLKAKFCMF